LHTHIKPIIDKFKGKLPKDDLKRHAKDVSVADNFPETLVLTIDTDNEEDG
jgi:hypothetical protein